MIRSRLTLRQRAITLSTALQTIINDHIRLKTSHHIDQLRSSPLLPTHIIIGKIKPQNIQLSIIGTDLTNLIVHICKITVKIPGIILIFRMISHRMIPVTKMRIILMVPVKQCKIKTNLQTFPSHSFHKLSHKITSTPRIRRLKICILTVKQTEAIMMLRCKHHIFHPCFLRSSRPRTRIIIHRIKLLKILHIIFFRHFLHTAHPFTSRRDRIKPPVNKHTKTRIQIPFHPFVVSLSVKCVHRFFPFVPLPFFGY